MKKLVYLITILSLLIYCGPKQDEVERIIEDGVEVVINHLEPYQLKGESSTFDLVPVLTIDMERDDIVQAGMGQAGEFDIDGEGNIFVVAFKNTEHFIYKFNSKGELVTSFGRYGQGPGEIEWPFLNKVFEDGRIAITDFRIKYKVFDKKGNLIQEIHPEYTITFVSPLENGNFLVGRPRYDRMTSKDNHVLYSVSLCDSDFKEIKELDSQKRPLSIKKLSPVFMWRVSAGHIYIANDERGYEILDYDFEGNLRRKIRKAYRPAVATNELKGVRLGPGYNQSGNSHDGFFPNPLPPFASFFVDDEGRFFVMTYESGNSPGEYMYDFFNAGGVFIGRKSLNLGRQQYYSQINYAKIKNGLLYHYREKENGFDELLVRRVIWKE